jgi:outer membrane receptor protein involved in Fe transport
VLARAIVSAIASLVLLAAAGSAAAQIMYGGVVGVVKDSQGSLIPGATVTIVNKDTNLTRDTVTDAQGAYNFLNVLPGPYDLKVVLQGFSEARRTGLPVTVGQISRADVTLEVGALTESVTVKSEAQLLQTDKADVHTELSSAEITNLPLNQFRNYQALVVLVPGSLPPTLQNAETDTPQRSLNMTVNGQGGAANTTLTDGSRNVNVGMPYHNIYNPPAETIDTVTITTGSMDAEQGMAAGAAITVTTKSGTNVFKGSAFEFFNNQKLNANPYYFGRGAAPVKLPVERNTAGGTLGGPILRDRLFFFGSYEGYFSRREQFTFYTVPDAALRSGDFSNALNTNGTLQRIFDPITGDLATGTGRVAFGNNVIPAGRIHPIAAKLVQMYPMPNVEGTGAGGLTNNYRTQQRSTTDRHNFDAKVNWNRTRGHQLWGKFSALSALVDDLFTFPIGESNDDGGDTKVYLITGGQTWSFTPTLLLDTSFGLSLNDQFVSSPDFRLGNLGLELGIPGTNDQGRGDPRYAGLPQFSTGFTAIGGTPTWSPIYMEQKTLSFNTNLTKIAGKHDFKAGYFLNQLAMDNWQPERANPRGSFTFNGNATRTFGTGSQTANFYNQYAQFLLGLVSNAGKSYQYELFTAREWQHAMYFRDRWTVNEKLTLDLGVRWEYYPIMRRADRQIEMLDLRTLDVLIGGVAGNPKNMGLVAPKDDFMPRAGLVYRLNDQTVLRTGYGSTRDARGMSAQEAFRGDLSYPLVLNSSFIPAAAGANFGWYDSLDKGVPFLAGPDLSSGRVALPNAIAMQTAVPSTTSRGTTYSWNAAIERRLPLVSVDAAYVGNKMINGLQPINANPVLHLGGGAADRPYFVSHGRQLAVNLYQPYQRSSYHALQVGLARPFLNGLQLKGHYTYSRSMSLGTSYQLPTPEAQDRNWALASTDRPHTFTMSFVYQLPWQTSGAGHGFPRILFSDWQINGIVMAFSGAPFTVTADGTALNTPNNTQTADLVGTVTKIGGIGAGGVYFDPSAWAQPEGMRFGTSRLNQFRGPGGWNLDLSVFRSIPIGPRQRIELRAEAANVTNTFKFANPTANITSGDFMRIFGLNNAFTERQIRLGLRFTF